MRLVDDTDFDCEWVGGCGLAERGAQSESGDEKRASMIQQTPLHDDARAV